MSREDLAVRLYRVALFAFPRALRVRFGPEMCESFEAMMRSRGGRLARVAFFVRALLDVLRAGVAARLTGVRRGRPRRSSGDSSVRLPGGAWATGLGGDLRAACRSLARSPAYTVCGALVLALGIGANGAAFTALRATLLAEPPYPHLDRLAVVDLTLREGGRLQVAGENVDAVDGDAPQRMSWSYPKFLELLRDPDQPFEAVVGYVFRPATLTSHGDAEIVSVEVVSPGYFELLGVRPDLGSTLPEEPAGAPVVVLSRALFDSRYGGDADLIGKPIRIGGQPVVVAGVAPAGFAGLTGRAQAWIAFESIGVISNPRLLEWPQAHWFFVLGRLPVGRSFEQARSAMALVGERIARTLVDDGLGPDAMWSADLRPLVEARRNPNAGRAVMVLSVASALVLVIACANLAALQLARASARVREVLIRRALGAARFRLLRSLGMESLLLGLIGGSLGLLFYLPARAGFAALWPETFREGEARLFYADAGSLEVGITGLAFHFLVAAAAGLAFGVGPALWASGRRGASHARTASAAGAASRRGTWLRECLVGGQVALAVVFLVAAGLLVRTLFELRAVPLGFDPDGLLVVTYELPRDSTWAERPDSFHEAFRERVAALPGVEGASVGLVGTGGHWWITGVREISGRPPFAPSERPEIGVDSVSDGHFATIGTPLLAGRSFDARDRKDSPPVVVVNETAARRLFGGVEQAVGERIAIGTGLTPEGATAEIIGVVGDVLYDHPAKGAMAESYVTLRQQPVEFSGLAVRASGDPFELVPAVRDVLRELDPALAVLLVSTVEDLSLETLGETRALVTLLLAFAAVAVLLAAAGTYGVVASRAAQRDRELGIRLALGAEARRLVRTVLLHGVATASVGVVLGVLVSSLLTAGLQSFLFEVDALDPLSFAAAVVVLAGIAALASWLPARRVARLDPAATLRAE